MGLSVALDNALSGLRSTQVGLDTVSRNVANAGVEGYVRRTVDPVERDTGGVRDASVRRVFDSIVQRQLRTETAGGSYTGIMAEFLTRLDEAFGVPGAATSLDTQFNAFATKMQGLANEPASATARLGVLASARTLAGTLNGLSGDVQTLRGDAEMRIASAVTEANTALRGIEQVSRQLVLTMDTNARADLLDQRDRQIDRLAGLMDIRVNSDGEEGLSIFTASGVALYSGRAAQLSFDARGAIGAQALYDPVATRSGVGQLSIVDVHGSTVNITDGGLRSGEIAGLLELRDHTLVEAQARLDAVAAGLSRALSDEAVPGTAATAGAATGFDLDLSRLQAGNVITLDVVVQPSGQAQRFSFVRVNSAAALPVPQTATADPDDTVVGIDFSGGMASVTSAIQTALGSAYAVSNPSGAILRVVDDGAGGTSDVAALLAEVTNTALTGQGLGLPLFIDAANGLGVRPFTGFFEGRDQTLGFAARIGLNPALTSDPSKLVAHSGATLPGDPARPGDLMRRLTSAARDFPGDPADPDSAAYRGTIGEFTRRIMDEQVARASEMKSLDEGQQVVVSSLRERFSENAGVSVDQELARLVSLQNAYAANARIVSAVRDMLDTLMRI